MMNNDYNAILSSKGKKYKTIYADPPYIELFARETILGWDAWGNEINILKSE